MPENEQKQYKFHFDELTSAGQLSSQEQKLIEMAQNSGENAYAPYSRFSVGAAVLLENGEIICGSNQENAAYPSGLCAERVALFYASSHYPDVPVKALAIVASKNLTAIEEPVPPCGSCRQVFAEWEKRFHTPFVVIMAGTKKIIRIEKASWLLPFDFQSDYL